MRRIINGMVCLGVLMGSMTGCHTLNEPPVVDVLLVLDVAWSMYLDYRAFKLAQSQVQEPTDEMAALYEQYMNRLKNRVIAYAERVLEQYPEESHAAKRAQQILKEVETDQEETP